jgi:hypothetical protein
MDTQHVTLVAEAHDGKVTVQAEIPVAGDADTYLVTIAVEPQHKANSASKTLDALYGALSDAPIPEIERDLLPEQRDELKGRAGCAIY